MPVDPEHVAWFIGGMAYMGALYCFVKAGLIYRQHRRDHKAQGRLTRFLLAQTLEQGRVRTAMD